MPKYRIVLAAASACLFIAGGFFAPRVFRNENRAELRPELQSRPEYRHAVVRKGVYSAAEAQAAIGADPIVRAHYSDVQVAKLQRTSSSGRPMYASYRRNDRVYWTSKPVSVPKGEAVLSDGVHLVRARCGNRLSETPQKPTANVHLNFNEPTEEVLDTTVAQLPSELVIPGPLDAPPGGYSGDGVVSRETGGLIAGRTTAPSMPVAPGASGADQAPMYRSSTGGGFGQAPIGNPTSPLPAPSMVGTGSEAARPSFEPAPSYVAIAFPGDTPPSPSSSTFPGSRTTTEFPNTGTPSSTSPEAGSGGAKPSAPGEPSPGPTPGLPITPPAEIMFPEFEPEEFARAPEQPLAETPEPSVTLLTAVGLLTVASIGRKRLMR